MATTKTTKTAAKPVAKTAAKPAAKSTAKPSGITAYCVKTKERDVPMLEAVIDVNNNRYIAKGLDAAGNKMTAILSGDNAKAHVKSGAAKKGAGW